MKAELVNWTEDRIAPYGTAIITAPGHTWDGRPVYVSACAFEERVHRAIVLAGWAPPLGTRLDLEVTDELPPAGRKLASKHARLADYYVESSRYAETLKWVPLASRVAAWDDAGLTYTLLAAGAVFIRITPKDKGLYRVSTWRHDHCLCEGAPPWLLWEGEYAVILSWASEVFKYDDFRGVSTRPKAVYPAAACQECVGADVVPTSRLEVTPPPGAMILTEVCRYCGERIQRGPLYYVV